jgi:hypothetical protein
MHADGGGVLEDDDMVGVVGERRRERLRHADLAVDE